MPLAFRSESHGTVAFGFFQIEIDMLLLDRLFFFADVFCRAAVGFLVEGREATIDGYLIDRPERIGNLHGAIAGTDLSGFIGATYRRFPFPRDPAAFRQNPDTEGNRAWARDLVRQFGGDHPVNLRQDRAAGTISVDEYVFRHEEFMRLVAYVDRGGLPRWRDDIRPAYARAMMESLARRRQGRA